MQKGTVCPQEQNELFLSFSDGIFGNGMSGEKRLGGMICGNEEQFARKNKTSCFYPFQTVYTVYLEVELKKRPQIRGEDAFPKNPPTAYNAI